MAANMEKEFMPQDESVRQEQSKGKGKWFNQFRKNGGKGRGRASSKGQPTPQEIAAEPHKTSTSDRDLDDPAAEAMKLQMQEFQASVNAEAKAPETTEKDSTPQEHSLPLLQVLGLLPVQVPETPEEDHSSQIDDVTAEVQPAPSNKMLSKPNTAEKIKVYYVQVKDGILEIVGKVGQRVIFVKAKVSEVVGASIETLNEALSKSCVRITAFTNHVKSAIQTRTLRILDACIAITVSVEDKLLIVKAKVVEAYDMVKAKAIKALGKVDEITLPMRSRVGALYDASKAKTQRILQPLQPYYVKVHAGVVNVVTTVGNRVVMIQAKVSDVYTSIQVRTVESTRAALAVIDRITNPVVSRTLAISHKVTDGVQHYMVSLKRGVFVVVDAVGNRVAHIKAKLHDLVTLVSTKVLDGVNGTKKVLADLTARLSALVSQMYGRIGSSVKLLYTRTHDGLLYVACQVEGKVVVLRIKVSEVIEYLLTVSRDVYASGRTAILNRCGTVKLRLLEASQATKTKALQVGTTVRTVASKRETHVAAASAAGGAAAMGATGGAAGLVAGGGVGVILAPFTFGMSIPLGAGAGLCFGTATGGTAGFIAGGAVGYGAQKHKEDIGNGFNGAVSKAKAYKSLAATSTNKLCAKVTGHTGGTVDA